MIESMENTVDSNFKMNFANNNPQQREIQITVSGSDILKIKG